jgi:hypothetical protein
MTYVIINFDADTPLASEMIYPLAPFRIEALHTHHLLQ